MTLDLMGASLEPVAYETLPAWRHGDSSPALATWLKTAHHACSDKPVLRPAREADPALMSLFHRFGGERDSEFGNATGFFELYFRPYRVVPQQGRGFLTGYYEPEIPGSLERSDAFPVPVLARPSDLVTFPTGATPEPLDPELSAARKTVIGFEPYFDRAAIEDGALDSYGLELLYLPDRVELFFAQVQGSARVRLPDGTIRRLTYAGRNGHAYTTIARVIIAEGHMALHEVDLGRLKHWLRSHPDHARRIMRLNRSYIFFSCSDALRDVEGPIGGGGTTLDADRSIAIDRRIWSYGLPFFISARLPDGSGADQSFARLMIAQDTGSAILGAARADLFMGSGDQAGHRAGLIRQPGDFFVFLPKD